MALKGQRMTEPAPTKDQRVDWRAVALFYAIACAVSWPFFWMRDLDSARWERWRFPGMLVIMWGPGIAALLTLRVFRGRHRRQVTLFGTSWRYSLLFYVAPLLLLSALGGGSWDGYPPHLSGIAIIFVSFATIMGEELGWRGFLQDALRPLSRPARYALIGFMWEFWHFTNRTTGKPLSTIVITLLISYPAAIALSWIIGEAVERSRSLLIAHTLHIWLNLPFELTIWQTFLVLALALVFWGLLLWKWPPKPATAGASSRGAPTPTYLTG
jgi:uncharacterized protein